METTQEEFEKSIQDEWREEEEKQIKGDQDLKEEYRNKLQALINVDALYAFLQEQTWKPLGIVDIILVDEKTSGYAAYQHARIIDIDDTGDNLLYCQTSTDGDIEDVEYYYVWQQTGYFDDDFSGYILFPLNNGKFFKVSYSY